MFEVTNLRREMYKRAVECLKKNKVFDDNDMGFEVCVDYNDEESFENALKLALKESDGYDDVENRMCDFGCEFSDEHKLYNYDYYKESIVKCLDKHNVTYDESLIDDIMSDIYCYCNYDWTNTELDVIVRVNTGDGNYDFTCNHYLNFYDGMYTHEGVSSIEWLAKQQGKWDLVSGALLDGALDEFEKFKGDKFCESLVEECENLPNHIAALVFLTKMTFRDLMYLNDKKKAGFIEKFKWSPHLNPDKTCIILDKRVECGLFDHCYGGGSIIGIELDKDVQIPLQCCDFFVDGAKQLPYDISEVYGEAYWRKGYKGVIINEELE